LSENFCRVQKIMMYSNIATLCCAFTSLHCAIQYNFTNDQRYLRMQCIERTSLHVSAGTDSNLLSHIRFHPCKHVARVCASVCYVAIWRTSCQAYYVVDIRLLSYKVEASFIMADLIAITSLIEYKKILLQLIMTYKN